MPTNIPDRGHVFKGSSQPLKDFDFFGRADCFPAKRGKQANQQPRVDFASEKVIACLLEHGLQQQVAREVEV
jgi:hypothetical protein